MPEKQNIERTSKWKDEYLARICVFANVQGGRSYIGCDDNGNAMQKTETENPDKITTTGGNCMIIRRNS